MDLVLIQPNCRNTIQFYKFSILTIGSHFTTVNVVDGEMLLITKVSRLHMAAYLCVASNGV